MTTREVAIPTGRPKFSFFLLDTPSDHEIDGRLATECQIVSAILHNRGFKSVVKTETISSKSSFLNRRWTPYDGVGFVHIAGHGSRQGLELIEGRVTWSGLAEKLSLIAPPLIENQQRVLSLSFCYSKDGARELKPIIRHHFTGVYYFQPEKIDFSDAITTYAMFFTKKNVKKPHQKVVDSINRFLGRKILAFMLV